MSLRSQAMPSASTLAHWIDVSRIVRASSFSSGGVGGRPRGRFGSSMVRSVNDFLLYKKRLALLHLLYNNKSTLTQ